jgi:hypothetical protein
MATIKELVNNTKVNYPITDKRILSYFKRIGFIWDYSQYGYLEGVYVRPQNRDEFDKYFELFSKQNAKELEKYNSAVYKENGKIYRQGTAITDIPTHDEILELYGYNSTFEWNGNTFGMKYVDGCFCPYLVKIK